LVRGQPGQKLSDTQMRIVHKAVELYEGDLLEGCYQDWCLHERERLQTIYLILLDKLMDFCQAHRRFEESWYYGNQILAYDQAREHTHRQLMQLFYEAGDRTGALRQYERCKAILEEELGVKPSKRTMALYQQICADMQYDSTTDLTDVRNAPRQSDPLLHSMLDRLKFLKTVISDLQAQVDKEIQTVEQALKIEP
jgi:DNA-binding SARP family transcriptional activator